MAKPEVVISVCTHDINIFKKFMWFNSCMPSASYDHGFYQYIHLDK